jgi:hypothetical protein
MLGGGPGRGMLDDNGGGNGKGIFRGVGGNGKFGGSVGNGMFGGGTGGGRPMAGMLRLGATKLCCTSVSSCSLDATIPRSSCEAICVVDGRA